MKGRFCIIGKEGQAVTGVGCRIKIYRHILENPCIKNGIARNIDKNKVEILVETEGGKEVLEAFREEIKQLKLPDVSTNPGFEVTALDISERVQVLPVPTTERTSSSLTLEQLDKAVGAFIIMQDDLHALPTRFAVELGKVLKQKPETPSR